MVTMAMMMMVTGVLLLLLLLQSHFPLLTPRRGWLRLCRRRRRLWQRVAMSCRRMLRV
jgi:hypothetical protein